jgi:hypothetical protein
MQAKRTPATDDNPTKRFIELTPVSSRKLVLRAASYRSASLLYARLGRRIPLHVSQLLAFRLGLRRICGEHRSRDAEQKTRDDRRAENFGHCCFLLSEVFPQARANVALRLLSPDVRRLTDQYGSAVELFPRIIVAGALPRPT